MKVILQVYSDDSALWLLILQCGFCYAYYRISVTNCRCLLSKIVLVISYILKKLDSWGNTAAMVLHFFHILRSLYLITERLITRMSFKSGWNSWALSCRNCVRTLCIKAEGKWGWPRVWQLVVLLWARFTLAAFRHYSLSLLVELNTKLNKSWIVELNAKLN